MTMEDEKESDGPSAGGLLAAVVEFSSGLDASDVIKGLNGNDELVLTFVCQLIALSHSSELRERLLERLGITIAYGGAVHYNAAFWSDEEYL